MESATNHGRARLTVILATLATAVAFETMTVFATQNKRVRAVSPWQDDPYDVFVSFAQFAVPMLALAIAVRLPAWRAPGAPDRAQQTTRAACALITLIGLTLGVEWAAVIVGAHAADRDGWTSVLIAGLVMLSLPMVAVVAALVRYRSPRGASRCWRHDWLGDVTLIGRRIPVVRRWATPGVVERVRAHAVAVFVTVSLLLAAGVIGAQAVGERWTDPLLIAWACTVVATTNFAFCVAANTVAGFIARPPRSKVGRVAETSVLAGAVAVMLTTAFRDALWAAVTGGPVTSVPVLVSLTVGTGLAVSLVTAVLLQTRLIGAAR